MLTVLQKKVRLLRDGEHNLLILYTNTILNVLLICYYFVMKVPLSFQVNFTCLNKLKYFDTPPFSI
jgi:hypothetical protein